MLLNLKSFKRDFLHILKPNQNTPEVKMNAFWCWQDKTMYKFWVFWFVFLKLNTSTSTVAVISVFNFFVIPSLIEGHSVSNFVRGSILCYACLIFNFVLRLSQYLSGFYKYVFVSLQLIKMGKKVKKDEKPPPDDVVSFSWIFLKMSLAYLGCCLVESMKLVGNMFCCSDH